MKKSEIISLITLLLSGVGLVLSDVAHKNEMEELKNEVIAELRSGEVSEEEI